MCKFLRMIIVILLTVTITRQYASGEDDYSVPLPGEEPEIPDYRGDIWTNKYMLGDGTKLREGWAEKGIVLSIDLVQSFQFLTDGGKDTGSDYGGSLDYELNLDFQKMGLWPGAFVRVFGETQYGDFVNSRVGALATNLDGVLPLSENKTTLTSVIFTQFLTEWAGLYLGKLETLDGDMNEFAHGRGKDQFLNQNFVFNPVTLRTAPYTTWGGGAIFVLPDDRGLFSLGALDPSGQPDEIGLDDIFEDGVVYTSELRLNVKPMNLPGHQSIGGTWSTKDYTLLDIDARGLLRDFITTGAIAPAKDDGSWSLYYNFDQFLYAEEEDITQGIGLFGRFGVADKETNPIEHFYSFGVGG